MESETRGHFFDSWIAGLRKVSRDGVSAWVIDSPFGIADEWDDEAFFLSLLLFQPTPKSVAEMMSETSVELWEDIDPCDIDTADPEAVGKVRRHLAALREGCAVPFVRPEQLFQINLHVTGAMGWTWGYSAVALTERLAVIGHWDDESYNLGPLPLALGLAERSTISRSTALLFESMSESYETDHFKDYSPKRTKGREPRRSDPQETSNFYDRIKARGIEPVEVYRLLLAMTKRGAGKLATMEAKDLVKYREADMSHGYEDVLKLVSRSSRKGTGKRRVR